MLDTDNIEQQLFARKQLNVIQGIEVIMYAKSFRPHTCSSANEHHFGNQAPRRGRLLLLFVLLLCLGLWSTGNSAAVTMPQFVDDSAAPGGDGSSWATAFNSIQPAVAVTAAAGGGEVWVAEGDYISTGTLVVNIPAGVKVYGGFTGNESVLSERNPTAHQTIIDGQHVRQGVRNSGIIDGVWVKNGLASQGGGVYNYSSGTVTGCTVTSNSATSYGGGIYNYGSGKVTGCTVTGNSASSYGGGVYNSGTVTGCTVTGNSATSYGGGVFNSYGTVTNCTVTGNSATTDGGGVYNSYGTVTNCTMTGNSATSSGGGVYNSGTVTNCIAWHNGATDINNGSSVSYSCFGEATESSYNVLANPHFVSTAGNDPRAWDLKLLADSPCIDTGSTMTQSLPATDLAGNPRPGGDRRVDMGAYESPDAYVTGAPAPPVVLYVSPQGDGTTGQDWARAFNTITSATQAAMAGSDLCEIRVAAGTYREGREIRIVGKIVSLSGGWSGNVTQPDERNVAEFKTIIDGEKKHRCFTNDRLLDGLWIQNGSADRGGGVYSSGTVTSCTLTGNSATSYGGGVYSSGKVTGCTLTGNSATSYGGGVYSSGTVTSCTLTGNSATSYGGGVYSSGKVTGCTVTGNSSTSNGGGVYNYYGTVTSCMVTGNSTTTYGGGVYNYYGTATNCTVTGNSATSSGGGVYNNGTVTNCIVWRNSATDIGGNLSSVSYSCFIEATGASHNLRANPRFVSTAGNDPLAWDLRLLPDSPCIDTGTTAIQSLPATDLAGNPRPGGDGRVDMGAYESPDAYVAGAPASPVVLYVSPQGDGTTGQDWARAFNTITSSTQAAMAGYDLYEIRVAAGTYREGREIVLCSRASLIGGWSGNGAQPDERDAAVFKTVIDGEKKYRCITNAGLLNGLWIQNGSADSGGGVYSSGTVTGCKVTGNSATSYGGGVYSSGTVTGCTVTSNSATTSGGGVYNYYGTVTNCTMTSNSATTSGGGVYNNGTVTNCIAWRNGATDISGGLSSVSYSCFGEATESSYNVRANPHFVSTAGNDPQAWDLKLLADSPCIDTGSTAAQSLPATDLAGNPRPGGDGRVDMGAYESPDAFPFTLTVAPSPVFSGLVTVNWGCSGIVSGFVANTRILLVRPNGDETELGTGNTTGTLTFDSSAWPDGPTTLRAVLDYRIGSDPNQTVMLNREGFTLNSPSVRVHQGSIGADETWTSETVHVVVGTLLVNGGARLRVQPGTIVKFYKNAAIQVATGGTLEATGTTAAHVIFTPLEDDTAGGDTNLDGGNSTPNYGTYDIAGTGSIAYNEYVELRYLKTSHSGPLSGNETWRGDMLHRLTANVSIPSGKTLRIQPGAIVKFDRAVQLIVQTGGTLIAEGDNARPIIFTSIKDDAHGGDTNGDGGASLPAAGDWSKIYVSGGTASFAHASILNASDTNNNGAIYITGGNVTLDSCAIAHTLYDALRNAGGTLDARNSLFFDSSMAVRPAGGTSTFTNCTIADVTTAVRGTGTFVNCVFSNVASVFDDPGWGSSTFQYCLYWNPAGFGPQSTSPVGSNGNIWGDPKFRDLDVGDFRLMAHSAAIDAADGSRASATDYAGAPRYDDPQTPNTGIAAAGGAFADIGALEYSDTAQSVVDLVARNVAGPVQATVGEEITVNWDVANIGAESATGAWRDSIGLRGDGASVAGIRQDLGEALTNHTLAPGASVNVNKTSLIPPMKSGAWRYEVKANARGDIFEGLNAQNNVTSATATVTILVPPLVLGTPATGALSATQPWSEAKWDQPAGVDGIVTLDISTTVSLFAGFDRVPSSTANDLNAVAVAPGQMKLYIPATNRDREVYFYLETSSGIAADTPFTLTLAPGALSLFKLDVTEAPVTGGEILIPFHGARFAQGMGFTLKQNGGIQSATASEVTVDASGKAWCKINPAGLPSGSYDAIVNQGGQQAVLGGAFVLKAQAMGPVLEAHLIAPTDVRDGRKYLVWVDYANVGDMPMLAPRFIVEATDGFLALDKDGPFDDSTVLVMGISSSAPAGWLKPGDRYRIPVYLLVNGDVQLNLSHSPVDDSNRNYYTGLSDATTRLNKRGLPVWDAVEIMSFYESMRSGDAVAAISGTIRNSISGIPLEDQKLRVRVRDLAAPSNTYRYFQTGKDGYFVIPGLPDNVDIGFSTMWPGLAFAEDTTITLRNGVDENGVALTAKPFAKVRGRVLGENGQPVENAEVTMSGKTSLDGTLSDSEGYYALTSDAPGTFTLVCNLARYLENREKVLLGENDLPHAIQLQCGAKLTAAAVDEAQHPVAGCMMNVRNWDGQIVDAVSSDDQGRFLTERLPANKVLTVDFEHPDFIPISTTTTLQNGTATNLNVELKSGGEIHGHLQGATAGTTCTLLVWTSEHQVFRRGQIKAAGDFRVAGLSNDAYTLYAVSDGTILASASNIQITGSESREVNLLIEQKVAVTGTVVTGDTNTPIPNALVTFENTGDGSLFGAITDGQGHYSVEVWPGNYNILGGHEDYQVAESVRTISTAEDILITLAPATVDGPVSASRPTLETAASLKQALTMQNQGGGLLPGSSSLNTLTGEVLMSSSYALNSMPSQPVAPIGDDNCPANQHLYRQKMSAYRLLQFTVSDANACNDRAQKLMNGIDKETKDGLMNALNLAKQAALAKLLKALRAGKGLSNLPIHMKTGIIESREMWARSLEAVDLGLTTGIDVGKLAGKIGNGNVEGSLDSLGEVTKDDLSLLGLLEGTGDLATEMFSKANEILGVADMFKSFADTYSNVFKSGRMLAELRNEAELYKKLAQMAVTRQADYERVNAISYTLCKKEEDDKKKPEKRHSCDPNEKAGTVGAGDPVTERFVNSGEELTYTIYFENKADATAAAQEVTVTDQLDPNLDWSTFKLGEVAFANQIEDGISGKASGTVQVDQTSSTLQVRIESSVDVKTGQARWYLRTVDPTTEDGWPADPAAGFLHPNDATHRGEGQVTFTIKSKAGLASQTKITNTARIVFDTNAPIDTNEVFNTIAGLKPGQPHLPQPYDGSTTATTSASLVWTGGDLASDYDLYLWKDGQAEPTAPTIAGRTSTFFDPGTLDVGSRYFWRVNSRNPMGVTQGVVWSFTVEKPLVGTVVIQTAPNTASWSLATSCACPPSEGVGNATLTDMAAGAVTLTWGTLPNYDPPMPNPDTRTLGSNETLTFAGTYIRQTGTVVVDVTPDTAPWSFTDGDGTIHNGSGDATVNNVPTGSINLTWGALAGHIVPTPNPANQSLTQGATVTFAGNYTRQKGAVMVDVTPDTAPWSFTDGDGTIHNGSGDATVNNVPTGTIKLTWGALAGYDKPVDPGPTALAQGTTVPFSGTYTRQTGTVQIQVTPKTVSWTLTDGDGTAHTGTGDAMLSAIPTGPVSLHWGELANYDAPAPQSRTLAKDATVSFIGSYTDQLGSVSVRVRPESASWSLRDSRQAEYKGSGNQTLGGIPVGPLQLTWSVPAGYDPLAKNPATATLTKGMVVSFFEIFVPSASGPERTQSQILRYLLGLSADPSGLDTNGDHQVTAADLIRNNVGSQPPTAPATPSPADKATMVSVTTNLDWADSTRGKTYDVYLWSGQAKPATASKAGLATSFYDPPTSLTYATRYSWQVVAKNGNAQTAGPTWSFTTKPQPVQLLSPNTNQTWTRGAKVQIHWKLVKSLAGTSVRFDLWRNNARVKEVGRASSATGEATSTVTVPTTLTAATGYKLRVVSLTLESRKAGEAWDQSDGSITIK